MKLIEFSEYCLHFLKQRILRSDAYIVNVVIRLAGSGNILLRISFLLTSDFLVSALKNIIEVSFSP